MTTLLPLWNTYLIRPGFGPAKFAIMMLTSIAVAPELTTLRISTGSPDAMLSVAVAMRTWVEAASRKYTSTSFDVPAPPAENDGESHCRTRVNVVPGGIVMR